MKDPSDVLVEGVQASGASVRPSSSLLLRVQARDWEAWQKLVRLYGPLVYSWCRRRGVRQEDAADIGQEVFLAVAKKIGTFRRDRPGDSFRGWLFGITDHKIRDYRRRRGRRHEVTGGSLDEAPAEEESPSTPPEIAPGALSILLHRALELVLRTFTEQTWQAFWRVTVEEQAAAAVAAALGMSSNAVHIAKSRVLHRLRQEFHDLIWECSGESGAQPISLYYAESGKGPWTPIAIGVANTGHLREGQFREMAKVATPD